MMRHLTAFHFTVPTEDHVVPAVMWRQWKRGSEQGTGVFSERSSAHEDQVGAVIEHDSERGEVEVPIFEPRYKEALQLEALDTLSKLCAIAEHVSGLIVARIGYAPGSPNVDLWWRDELGDLIHVPSQDSELHQAAHRVAQWIAKNLQDPDQPVEVWKRFVGEQT